MSTNALTDNEYETVLRLDFATFLERSFRELNPSTEFISGHYIELLAATLERIRSGEVKRLIINLPPRTLKSHAASVAFPAWLLGHDPSIQIICASYGQDLANKHARDCRTIMESEFYRQIFPRTILSPAKSSVEDFETTARGVRKATSLGGSLTGRGADIIIIDDILKPQDALSTVNREAANEWYFNTLLSRLNSKENGAIIIVMQRLHLGDLVGEVMDRGPWEVLSLPAIAIQDEAYTYTNLLGKCVFQRKVGEALHPERDSVETYRQIQETVGEYVFQSQYQQSPASRDGSVIKKEWLQYYAPENKPQEFDMVLQSWDTAFKSGEKNDYSVCTTWGALNGKAYLLDVYRRRMNFPELKHAAIKLYIKYDPTTVLVEDRGSGTALLQSLKEQVVCGLKAYNPPPGSDKEMRLSAQSDKFESGRVLLPQQAPWLDEYVQELTGFPGTKHDDQVDSTSQALDEMGKHPIDIFKYWYRMIPRGYETC